MPPVLPINPVVGLVTVAALVLATSLDQQAERTLKYQEGLAYSRRVGKAFLVVGTPKFMPWQPRGNHPCGDVHVDIDPRVLRECPVARVADVRALPFSEREFGAAATMHVLEHLPSVEDALLAWRELHRVADLVLVAGPSPLSPVARLVPDHGLWAYQLPDGSLYVEHRELWNPAMPGSWFGDHPLKAAVVGPDLVVKAATPRPHGQHVV